MIGTVIGLLRGRWREAILLAAFVALLGVWRQYRGQLIAKGRLEAQLAAAAVQSAALADSLVRIERRIDTVHAERIRWRTKLDSFPLPAVHDTIADTVQVQVEAGAIRACGAALTACEREALLLRDALSLERERRQVDSTAWATAVPLAQKRGAAWWQVVALTALGYGLGRALH